MITNVFIRSMKVWGQEQHVIIGKTRRIRRKVFQGKPVDQGFPGNDDSIVSVSPIFERQADLCPVGHNLIVLDTHIERFYLSNT